MCGDGIYKSATQAVLGVPSLGVSIGRGKSFLEASPAGRVLEFVQGRAKVANPCFQSRSLAQTLHRATAWGSGRGSAISPLLYDLGSHPSPGKFPESLGSEGDATPRPVPAEQQSRSDFLVT